MTATTREFDVNKNPISSILLQANRISVVTALCDCYFDLPFDLFPALYPQRAKSFRASTTPPLPRTDA